MDIQKVREVFDKGSVVITDGRLSVFYHRDASGWGEQTWSDETPSGNQSDSRLVFSQLVRNSDRFEMHFFGDGAFRMDFIVSSETHKGPRKQSWFMPLNRDKTPDEYHKEELEWIKANPSKVADFVDFVTSYDIHDPDELQSALTAWEDLVTQYDDTPVSENGFEKWKSLLSAARGFYSAFAIGSLETNEPEPGQDYGWAEFQAETYTHLVLSLSDQKKELFLRLLDASKTVSIEAGNNDGNLITYINLVFYS